MQSYEVKFEVPFEVLLNLHKSPIEAAADIRRQAAIRYYKTHTLSLGKAAELAEMSRFEFIDYLRFNNEPVFKYSDEELDEIKNDAVTLGKILA
jgi:predicted HTH domain antitoxin